MSPNLANRVNSRSRTQCAKYSEGWRSHHPSIPTAAHHPFRLEDSGITPRTLGVYFKDLRVVGTGASAFFQSTVGSKLNPRVAYHDIRRALRPKTRDILSGFSGVVRPREMLRKYHLHRPGLDENLTPVAVVLGSPGSGCTTFLKMLANQRETYRDVQGEVFYDSLTPDEIRAHSRGDLQVRSSFPSPPPVL